MSSLPAVSVMRAHELPYYRETGFECELFEYAYRNRMPLLLKGPTGCGKTRYVSHMAQRLGRKLYTVSCHDDLTAADLTGRYLLKGGDTVWVDGPLTKAVREGAICYLDEVVEARKDVTVVLHPVTDDRRMLPLERTGELLHAPPEFMLVVSYNPGYQNILKTLKPSTRQRFLAIEFGFPGRGRGSGDRGLRERSTEGAVRAACAGRERAARSQGAGHRGGRVDSSRRVLRHPDPSRDEAGNGDPGGAHRAAHGRHGAEAESRARCRDRAGLNTMRLFEPEETVGQFWHRLVGDTRTYTRYPEAAISFEAVQRRIGIIFRALGGSGAVRIVAAKPIECGHRLRLRQRLGLGRESIDRAALDSGTLRLPSVIDVFPRPSRQRGPV